MPPHDGLFTGERAALLRFRPALHLPEDVPGPAGTADIPRSASTATGPGT